MVWRTWGGKHRVLLGEADLLVEDSLPAFREAAGPLLDRTPAAHAGRAGGGAGLAGPAARRAGWRADALDAWRSAGVDRPGAAADARASGLARGRGRRAAGAAVSVDQLLAQLFPGGHAVARQGDLLVGTGRAAAGEVAVLGLCDGIDVGPELALRLAQEVLAVVRQHPGRPILALVDSRGQRMGKREEVLGLNGYLGHLAACVELARRAGHRTLALVHGQASSGSFLAFAALCDEIHAVEGAVLSVMNLPAMSRVTKIPLARLEALSAASPVLAPGLENYVAGSAAWSRSGPRRWRRRWRRPWAGRPVPTAARSSGWSGAAGSWPGRWRGASARP